MATALQRILQDYMDQHGLSVAAMEREAGLRLNVVRNILRGQSKRPTAETLQSLANLMGCTIQDLLSEEGNKVGTKTYGASETVISDPKLLKEVLDVVFQVCDKKGAQLTMKQLSPVLDEIYTYSAQKSPPEVDKTFVEWYLNKVIG